MNRARAAALAVCGLLGLLSCEGKPLLVGEQDPTLGGDGRENRPRAPRCADAAELRVGDSVCWPTRHVGRWHGFVTGDARYLHVSPTPLEYPDQELVLELEPDGSGYATFAGPDAGSSADCAGPLLGHVCVQPGLVLGYRYALGGLRMTGGPADDRRVDPLVAFSLTIAQPWSDPCQAISADAGP
ncbi:MAG TPA: hypothetical protein VFS67_08680, partial [Polyangiaceae bacterium]|nr:hypothetical protein [Polyangiaceae bacterium]